MSIGSQIVKRRKHIGMTQQALAERLDVLPQTVSSWERDESLPDTEKLKPLANALKTSISYLMEETDEPAKQWELHDAMFSVDNMLRRVRMVAQEREMLETRKAVEIMLRYHEGAVRKSNNGESVPYVIHPLMMACQALALGIDSDELIATALLHDVVEDCDVTADELDVNDNIRRAVELLSFEQKAGLSREESKKVYYDGIADNRIASIVKLLDRCNNVSTMAMGFSVPKMVQYIEETEEFVFPLLEKVRNRYDEYYDAAFLLKYQLLSVLETLKRIL